MHLHICDIPPYPLVICQIPWSHQWCLSGWCCNHHQMTQPLNGPFWAYLLRDITLSSEILKIFTEKQSQKYLHVWCCNKWVIKQGIWCKFRLKYMFFELLKSECSLLLNYIFCRCCSTMTMEMGPYNPWSNDTLTLCISNYMHVTAS